MPAGFHPLVTRWFERRFGAPTEPQEAGWPCIQAGRDTLISAPTGSGKTLAAFLACLDRLFREALGGTLSDQTQALYVSPLKALANDIEKNLTGPLAELIELANEEGLSPLPIRAMVRTGDTPTARRQAMVKRPPHVVVTTPESLYLLLTSTGGRKLLATTRTVICDEIHAVARDKRGAHLALSLERLEALAVRRPQRIGLSATQNPIEELGRFLVGAARVEGGRPDCAIVEIGRRRDLDLAIEVPDDELSSVASNDLWKETYDRVAALVRAHRTTLVFVNSRRAAERVAYALQERLAGEEILPHHGSLARARRLDTERRLAAGELRCVVATSSLELGIDIGSADLVVQLGSPGSVATGIQRIGRAGHWRGAIPKGRIFPMSRDELLECAALVRAVRAGRIEETEVARHPLDVLAQQIVAEVSVSGEGGLAETKLFELLTRAWPYRDLARESFDQVVAMLSEGIATRRGRAAALLHRDEVHHKLRGRRGSSLAALTGGGTIPDTSQYQVLAEPEGQVVGQVDEDFVVESLAGDVFLLGNASWRIRKIERGAIRVEDAQGAAPGLPFWIGEAPGRSARLSLEVSDLREELGRRLSDRNGAIAWLCNEAAMPEAGARQAVDYLTASRAVLGAIPTQRTIITERFFDEAGGSQVVIHAPFGARANRALGLALRERLRRMFDGPLQAVATDDGVLLSFGSERGLSLESLLDLLDEATVEDLLTSAALSSPMFAIRWRWDATRALALPRMMGGKKIPPPIARMRAEDLLGSIFPAALAEANDGDLSEIPDHPLVREALRDCLHEAMDFPALARLLARIEGGEISVLARDTAEPSPMSCEIVGARPWAFLDDAPLAERRSRAVAARRSLPPAEAAGVGALDPEAVKEVTEQVWPDVRNAEELHDLLLDLGFLPAAEGRLWPGHLESLLREGRAAIASRDGRESWIAAERVALMASLDPRVVLDPRLRPLPSEVVPASQDEAVTRVLRGWMVRLGPTTAGALSARLALPLDLVERGLQVLEREGFVLRGQFLQDEPPGVPHWCERSALARIHRLTMGRLRREIQPVGAADFVRFLTRWQHLVPSEVLHGDQGLSEVVKQLQGFHAPAGAWEREILPARIAGYVPALLDRLCMHGEVAWGRLSVTVDPDEPPRRRNAPTRNAPVTLALRSDLGWLASAGGGAAPLGPSAGALVDLLGRVGASFSADLAAMTSRMPIEIEGALWELVSAGAVTCDGFAGLRALIEAEGSRAGRRPGSVGGRWSLLPRAPVAAGELLERRAWQYLRRWGIVFRDLLVRELSPPPWRELLTVYRRSEARGELRGGRFVTGFSGEQFALPEAVAALRAVRRAERQGRERVELSAADPLNLVGIITPGPRVPATLGHRIVWVDGLPSSAGGIL